MIVAERRISGHKKFLKDFGIDSQVLDWLEVSDMEKLRELIDDVVLGEDRKYRLEVITLLAEIIAEQRRFREKLFDVINSLTSS